MHPILFKIGNFEVPAYGAILVIDFFICLYFLKKEAERMKLDQEATLNTAVAALFGGMVGAKLLLILVDWKMYLEDPALILGTLRSAGVIYGGQIGGALTAIWYIRHKKLPFWDTIDTMAPFLALGIGLGRLSCLAAGCCYGMHWEGIFALHFPDHPACEAPAGIGLFPIQVVAVLNGILLCVFLVWILRRRAFQGQVVALLMITYGLTRGLMEFMRGDKVRGLWFGGHVSTSQLIAMIGIVLGVLLYLRMRKVGDGNPKSNR